jgi:hypothetical protein
VAATTGTLHRPTVVCRVDSDGNGGDAGDGVRRHRPGHDGTRHPGDGTRPQATAAPRGTTPSGGHHPSRQAHAARLPSAHVHGVAVNPADDKLYLATHDGLFRYDATGPTRVGPSST